MQAEPRREYYNQPYDGITSVSSRCGSAYLSLLPYTQPSSKPSGRETSLSETRRGLPEKNGSQSAQQGLVFKLLSQK